MSAFKFNGDYRDDAQVAPYLEAFTALRRELESKGQYPYNASFVGKIAGLEAVTSKDEDTAIYMLQNVYAIRAEHERIAALEASGYHEPGQLSARKRFAHVVVYRARYYSGGTGAINTYDDARLVPDKDGQPYAIVPKGKRNGYVVKGARILVTP